MTRHPTYVFSAWWCGQTRHALLGFAFYAPSFPLLAVEFGE